MFPYKKIILRLNLILGIFIFNGCTKTLDRQYSLKLPSELTHGILPNGMHYYLYPQNKPKDSISLRLLVNAGSAMEDDTTDGIAHFIEHMTFNGTKNFAPGTLINYFQDNGMGFGNDTNAFTHLLHTCYQIDLPKNDTENLRKGLKVLWDQVFGCLFLSSEIEREKSVILSEMRTHDSVQFREYQAMSKFLYPKSLLSKRFVIGTESTIQSFKTEDFFNFYNQWYKPNRMSLIITGDFNKRELLKQIKSIFSTSTNKKTDKSIVEPNFGPILTPKDQLEVGVFCNEELPETTLYLHAQRIISPSNIPTLQDLKDSITWSLIQTILKQRLDELKNKTCLNTTQIYYSKDFNSIEGGCIVFSGNKNNLSLLIQELEQFHRTVSSFGFSQQELESAKNALKGQSHLDTTHWRNTPANGIANEIVKKLMQDSIFLSPEQYEKHLIEILPYITPEYCLNLWENLWKDGAFLFVSGPLDQTITADSIKKTFLESKKTVLKIPELLKKHEFLSPYNQDYSSKIIDRNHDKILDIETLRLSNQVRINLKQTNFEKDRILIHVGIGSGMLSLKNCPYPGIQVLLSSSFVDGGLIQCDRNTLNRIFDGKMINLDFDVEEDCYAFKCITNREHLLEQLQLIGAYMIEPAYRSEGLENFKKSIPSWYEYFDKTPRGVLMSKIPTFLTCNDSRFGYPEQSILLQRNFDEAKKILTPVFDQQYIEVSIVGDFDRTKLIDNLLSTFGKLQTRDAQKTVDNNEKILPWPQAQTKIFTCKTQLDKAILYIVWPTKAPQDADDIRKFTILSSVLENRLIQEIRQILGDTYSPKVDQHQSINYKDRGSINAILTIAPTKLDFIADRTMTIANDIAQKGITQDELNRAVKPIVTDLKRQIVTNNFWISWLSNWQSLPKKSELDLNNVKAYEKISKEAIDEFAKIYLKRSSAICIQIKPELPKQ